MRTYSVLIEQNAYDDDLFNGSFKECVDFINECGYTREDNDVKIAEIEVGEDGCAIYTYDIITEW